MKYSVIVIVGGTIVCTQILKTRMISFLTSVRIAVRFSATFISVDRPFRGGTLVLDKVDKQFFQAVGFIAQARHLDVLLIQYGE